MTYSQVMPAATVPKTATVTDVTVIIEMGVSKTRFEDRDLWESSRPTFSASGSAHTPRRQSSQLQSPLPAGSPT